MSKQPQTAEETVRVLLVKATRLENGCLQCHLAPNKKGYCPVGFGGRGAKKWRAHRLVYITLVCDVPDHLMVLHSCDNRRCIELNHLFVGTAKDNTQDMMNKGRNKYETHRKITPEIYEEIKRMAQDKISMFDIAKHFDVSYETIRIYLNGQQNVK